VLQIKDYHRASRRIISGEDKVEHPCRGDAEPSQKGLCTFHPSTVCYYFGRRPDLSAGSCRSEVIMNRTLRYILIGVGVLIVLLVAAPFFIPVNQFKPTIEEKATAALGRRVQLGNLSLSLLH